MVISSKRKFREHHFLWEEGGGIIDRVTTFHASVQELDQGDH